MTKEVTFIFANHIIFDKDICYLMNAVHEYFDKNKVDLSDSGKAEARKAVEIFYKIGISRGYNENRKYSLYDFFKDYNSGDIDIESFNAECKYSSELIKDLAIPIKDIISLIFMMNKEINDNLYVVYEDGFERELIRANIEDKCNCLNVISKETMLDMLRNKDAKIADSMIEIYASKPLIIKECLDIRGRVKSRYYLSTIFISDMNKKYIEGVHVDGYIPPFK